MSETTATVRLGYLLHAFIEIPAAINFFLFPSRQLGVHTPQAHPVIKQYALLLFSSVLIALIFAWRPEDELSGQVAGALAIYHVGPAVRSASRLEQCLSHPELIKQGFGRLTEPTLYLVVHIATGSLLIHISWTAYLFPAASDT